MFINNENPRTCYKFIKQNENATKYVWSIIKNAAKSLTHNKIVSNHLNFNNDFKFLKSINMLPNHWNHTNCCNILKIIWSFTKYVKSIEMKSIV